MNFLSTCSGIESASVAWGPLGWKALAFAEVDRFCSAVLKHHYPNVPNLGDITRSEEWPDYEAVHVVCGGTPCQSFSYAGGRTGMVDPRGALMHSFVAVVARYRPRWVVWENVPGVLSSNKGRDFGALLGLLGRCGYGFCWRVLDAQYFGLAQQRRRVFLVCHLGAWQPAAAVLLERACLSGNPPPSRPAWQDVAGTIGANASRGLNGQDAHTRQLVAAYGGNRWTGPTDLATACLSQTESGFRNDFQSETFITVNMRQDPQHLTDKVGSLDRLGNSQAVQQGEALVRRLTPTEFERLQGFSDGYTAIRYRGRPAKDGPRYRALGNAWPVPVARWLGERLQQVQAILEAPASDYKYSGGYTPPLSGGFPSVEPKKSGSLVGNMSGVQLGLVF